MRGGPISGFASSVTSASGAIAKREASARAARSKSRAERAEGVPPPKNSEVNVAPSAAGARASASRSSPASQRSTAGAESAPDAKSQYVQRAAQNGTCT